MEHSCPPLPPPPRLLLFPLSLYPTRRNVHHFPRQLRLPRTGDELHHQEAARVRVPCNDAPAPYHRYPEIKVLPPQDDSECKLHHQYVAN